MEPELGRDRSLRSQRVMFAIVFALNAGLAVALAIVGVAAESSCLIANAIDNASDAAVYAISFVAADRSARWKRSAATTSAVLLLVFAAGVLADVVRRSLGETEPIGTTMIAMALVAAVVNVACLRLLARGQREDVNLRAAKQFSLNDFVSNGGVLVAGALVAWTGWRGFDLIVGLGVAGIAVFGAISILRDVRRERLELARALTCQPRSFEPGGALTSYA